EFGGPQGVGKGIGAQPAEDQRHAHEQGEHDQRAGAFVPDDWFFINNYGIHQRKPHLRNLVRATPALPLADVMYDWVADAAIVSAEQRGWEVRAVPRKAIPGSPDSTSVTAGGSSCGSGACGRSGQGRGKRHVDGWPRLR